MSSPSAIVVDNVSKTYPGGLLSYFRRGNSGGTQALRDICLTVQEGETVGLLGPNGAGKTTLLKIIASLLYPSSGRVLVRGHDLVKEPPKARACMGLVTCDERSFYWRLSGRQNLAFFATLYGIPPAVAQRRVGVLLEALGLSYAADRSFASYSSGMKQKLAIARGLLGDPSVVLYDEPTRSLDPLSAQNIRQWIIDNRPNSPRTAHLIATNQLREAEQLCDRVLIINRGAMIAQGTIAEIRQRFHEEQQAIHTITFSGRRSAVPRPDPARGLLEVREMESEDGAITIRAHTRAGSDGLSLALASILDSGGRILRCRDEEAPFDEVFCRLVAREPDAVLAAQEGGRQ